MCPSPGICPLGQGGFKGLDGLRPVLGSSSFRKRLMAAKVRTKAEEVSLFPTREAP